MPDATRQSPSADAGAHLPPKSELLWGEVRVLSVLLLIAAAGAVFVLASGVLFMAFAGVLLAVVLCDLSDQLTRLLPLSRRWTLTIVFLALIASIIGFGWATAPSVIGQLSQVGQRFPQAFDAIDHQLRQWLGGGVSLSVRQVMPAARSLLGSLPMIVNTTFGVVVSLVVVFALGVYLAGHPGRYRDGLVQLFAPGRRREVRETLNDIGAALRSWLRGQLIAMVVMGLAAYTVLRLLGVPLALVLALTTALLELVPYIGAIVAAVPVVLVAFTESWQLAAYALAAYTALQMLEGYALVPLIQKRAISVPPAVIIFMQVLLGVLFGVVGIVLATPLSAALAVVVRRCYMGGVLHESETG